MAAKGEKVGSLYVDVGADISDLNTALDAAEKRLKSLSSGNYQFNVGAGQAQGGNDPIAALQKKLNAAKLVAPVSLTLGNGAINQLKQAILAGMAGFTVPVKVQMTGVSQGGQQIVVDGEAGTVVTPARAAAGRARSNARATQRPATGRRLSVAETIAYNQGGGQSNADEIAALQAERAQLEDALRAYSEEQYQKRVAANRRPMGINEKTGRYGFISRKQYTSQLGSRIERRMTRELTRGAPHWLGMTANEVENIPQAEIPTMGPTGEMLWSGDPYQGMTGRALFGMGQGRRPPPSRRLGVRGGLVPSMGQRPFHGPRELSYPTAIGADAPTRRMTPGVAGEYEGERTIREERYGPATGAYGGVYASLNPSLRGESAVRSRLAGKPVRAEDAQFDVSEELAARLHDRETRGRVREATEKLYNEMERREAAGKPALSERSMVNRLVGSGRGLSATGITRDQAREILFSQGEGEAREFQTNRTAAADTETPLQRAQAHLAELRARRDQPTISAPGAGGRYPRAHGADQEVHVPPFMVSTGHRYGFKIPGGIGSSEPPTDTGVALREQIHQQELLVRRLQRQTPRAEAEAPRLSIAETIAYNQQLSKAAGPTAAIENVAEGGGGKRGRARGAALGGGGVVDVFVTNWPATFGGGGGVSGPLRLPAGLESEEDVRAYLKAAASGNGAAPGATTGKTAKKLRYRESPVLQGFREPTEAEPGPEVAYSSATDPRMQAEARMRADEERTLSRSAGRARPGPFDSASAARTVSATYDRMLAASAPEKEATASQPSKLLRNLAVSRGFDVAKPDLESVRAAAQETNRDKAQLARERASLPERAPSTAFAQVFARLTGTKTRFERAVETERQAEVSLDTVRTTKAETEAKIAANRENFRTVRGSLEARRANGEEYKDEIAVLRGLRTEHRELAGSVGKLRDEEQDATTDFENAVKARQRAGGGLASAAQVGALFIGVKAFMLANQAFEASIEAVGAAIQPVVADLTDFADISKKVTGALRDQTLASKGNVDASIAAAGAQAGLSASTTDLLQSAGLGARVTGQAGAQAATQSRDIFRTGVGLGGRFDESLFGGTGGILNSKFGAEQLGGQPGALESLIKTLGPLQRRAEGVQPKLGTDIGTPFPIAIAQAVNQAFGAENTILGQGTAGLAKTPEDQAQAAKLYTAAVNDVNQALDRQATFVGASSKNFELLTNATDEQKKAMIDSAKTISGEAQQRAEELAARGLAVTRVGGGALGGQQFGEFAQQFTQGKTIQDPTLLVREQARAFNADLQASDLRRQQQQQVGIPGALAIQLAGHPLLPSGAGIIPRGTNPEALRPEGSTSLGPSLREMARGMAKRDEYLSEIGTIQKEGFAALIEQIGKADDLRAAAYGPTPGPAPTGLRRGGLAQETADIQARQPSGFEPQLPKFQELFAKLTKYGTELANIQQDLADKQALNAIQDYNQAITITVRNLRDARALAGQKVAQDKLGIGALERQNVLLQRQSQELAFQSQQLQLQQEQRRINFQVAIAGFQAPGLTSEEREARIEQAKKEAAFAQKQLDIQKQQVALGRKQFKIGVEIQDRSFLRTVQELEFQLNSLERGRKLTIDTKEATDRAAVLEALIAQTTAQIGTIVDQAAGIAEKVISVGQAVASAAGGAVEAVVNATVDELTKGVHKYERLANEINRIANQIASGNYTNPGPSGRSETSGIHAAGTLFNTSGATSMIVGEAGTETVAVLRNPRTVSASVGGGGGGQVIIQFNGPMNVRSDDDVKAVAREVEKMMNTRGALIGLRNLTR